MKYTLFIYFYNHILVLIICVNNSLGARTWGYGICCFFFFLNYALVTKAPIAAL